MRLTTLTVLVAINLVFWFFAIVGAITTVQRVLGT